MLLAIDVGNSHTVLGVHDGSKWVASWRYRTDIESTEDEVGAWLLSMISFSGINAKISRAGCASVVPGMDRTLTLMVKKFFDIELGFIRGDSSHGIKVDYNPPAAVGADRIANAIAALHSHTPPIVVVDFGTATTFDVIDSHGVYVGGGIMPGPATSLSALVSRTAKLPSVELTLPKSVIGKSTAESIQSGLTFGYAGAIDTMVTQIGLQLGQKLTVIGTGGLAEVYAPICKTIQSCDPLLTLDGIRHFMEARAN